MTNIREQLLDQFPILESPRLIMRQISSDDTTEMFRCITDPRVQRHTSFQPDTLRFPARMYRYFEESYRTLRDLHFAVVLKRNQEHEDRWVGICSLQYWDEAIGKARLGYLFSPSSWNQGFATEAVKSLLSFGFETMRLTTIEARCERDNPASERVLQKSGMSYCGNISEYRNFDGNEHHNLLKIYSIRSFLDKET